MSIDESQRGSYQRVAHLLRSLLFAFVAIFLSASMAGATSFTAADENNCWPDWEGKPTPED